MLKDVSVAQLQRLLESKQAKLDALQGRRQKLLKELETVDRKISALEGGVRRRRGRRGQNERSLIQYVIEILHQNKKGLTLRGLEQKILDVGYKTTSTNFGQTLYQSIYNHRDKVVHDPTSGTYKLTPKILEKLEKK